MPTKFLQYKSVNRDAVYIRADSIVAVVPSLPESPEIGQPEQQTVEIYYGEGCYGWRRVYGTCQRVLDDIEATLNA